MPRAVQIIFGLIGVVLIVYVAILGLAALFEWIHPGASHGRMARLTVGTVVGLVGVTAYLYFRRGRH